MGCCHSNGENPDLQLSIPTVYIKLNSEFNEIRLDSLPTNEKHEKKLNSTYCSAATSLNNTQRKDIEAAFLVPSVHRQCN